MNFEEYLESNLGSYKDELSKEQLSSLKEAYDKLLIWQNTANIALESSINDKKDINDYDKTMIKVQDSAQKLSDIMNEVKVSFGIENFEDSSKRSM